MVVPTGVEFLGKTGWCRLPCGRRVVAPTNRESNVFAVGILSTRFPHSREMTACASYGKLLSLVGETVCLPDVFSQDAKIPLLLYLRQL